MVASYRVLLRRSATFVTLLFAILYAGAGCQKPSGFERIVEPGEPAGSEVTVRNFQTASYDNEMLRWKLKSEAAYFIKQNNSINLEQVYLEYFESPGAKIVMEGQNGIYYQLKGIMIIRGKVVVRTPNGRKLYTEKLIWNEKQGKLKTNEKVKIVYPEGDIIRGEGMVADQELNKIVITEGRGYHPPGE